MLAGTGCYSEVINFEIAASCIGDEITDEFVIYRRTAVRHHVIITLIYEVTPCVLGLRLDESHTSDCSCGLNLEICQDISFVKNK